MALNHAGPNTGHYARRLDAERTLIVGLQQKLDEQLSYAQRIGRTHLIDNEYQ